MTDSLTIFGTQYTNVKGFKAEDGNNNTLAYIRPQGNKAISENGSNIDVAEYATVSVSVSGGGTIVSKSITANGTYNASSDNADGYSPVTVNVPDAFTITDTSNTTGTTAQITAGSGGGGGATQHEIHLEFSDSTDTDIDVYYDDSLIGTMITAYTPTTYNNKTVTLAQLDGVTWYEPSVIPIGTQLIDYTKCSADTTINSTGQAETLQWYYASDYTLVETGMNFSYRAGLWTYLAFYTDAKAVIGTTSIYNIATVDPNDSNTGYGNISGSAIPANAKYIRLAGTGDDSDHISLIRTS